MISKDDRVYVKDLCEAEGCNNQVGAGTGLVLYDLRGLRLRFCSYEHLVSWCRKMADIIEAMRPAIR